jgi:dynein heavy chain 1
VARALHSRQHQFFFFCKFLFFFLKKKKKVLSEGLNRHTSLPHVVYTLDAKVMHKDLLYGNLESTTREWTDGLFTHILRKIIENLRGESTKVHWIVFDGDVDPEWVENLNSLLDDNKLLTLPNGERLSLPDNVRILFEVDSLRYATQATVSRCGMIWFSDAVVTSAMTAIRYLSHLHDDPLDATELAVLRAEQKGGGSVVIPAGLLLQRECHAVLKPLFLGEDGNEEGPLLRVLAEAVGWSHVMEVSVAQMLNTLMTLIAGTIQQMQQRNAARPDLALSNEQVRGHIRRSLCSHMLWAFGGSLLVQDARTNLEKLIGASVASGEELPQPLEEHYSHLDDNCWRSWAERVPAVEIETHQVASPDVVIPTVDTMRHGDLIATLLSQRAPLILCGPPGSGKTMTLFSTLNALPDADVVTLNFSSATSPELLLNTFAQHCEYKTTPKGPVLRPITPGKWLVLFCDEINLPAPDKYGTQRVITFLRQLTERGGFWRGSDQQWVHLERIQFVGACNPPTDPGRVPLPARFLRFAPVVLVGFPSRTSLQAIYGTMTRALLKLTPELRAQADPLTQAMLDVYQQCQRRFTPDMHAHYIFSPRELSRWVRSLHSALCINGASHDDVPATVDGLVRLWLHEGLRLFQDRLVEADERRWLDAAMDQVAMQHFGQGLTDPTSTLKRPVLFCSWMSNKYAPVHRAELREYVRQRLKVCFLWCFFFFFFDLVSFATRCFMRRSWTFLSCCSMRFWTTFCESIVCFVSRKDTLCSLEFPEEERLFCLASLRG